MGTLDKLLHILVLITRINLSIRLLIDFGTFLKPPDIKKLQAKRGVEQTPPLLTYKLIVYCLACFLSKYRLAISA